ncbi:uncharacterized protein N7484_010562 [Penicillium longicatenatum]|uniref:uncharacterized protein n=1 Tax=Penicillium longicatenatum TaxID=1561947 RepID=UPI0025482812|nr:uncharacterized protein N7484_010562 [Penicillium longicatenatum]KAJ5630462.1 hypothetical protein N7484_010562 [Penicillium longicatenatum]
MGNPDQKPWLFNLRSSETFLVLTVSIAIFTIVPIIPVALVERVGARPQDAQYLVSILLAVYGGTLLAGSRKSNQFHPSESKLKDIALFGYFADKSSSRKLPFVLGLIALGTSTALFAFARTFPILVIARGLQGFSAAAVWVVGLAIVSDNVPPERIGAALGTTTIGLTWGFLLGPMVSGYIHDTFGYYGCFAIPVILIVVDVVLRFAMIELPKVDHRKPEPQPEPAQHSDSDSDCQDNLYDTFNANDIRHPRRLSRREREREDAPLLGPSSQSVEHPAKDNEQHATILSLLRTPRLPLSLVATTSMAITLSALETVRIWLHLSLSKLTIFQSLPLFTMETFGWTPKGAGLIFLALTVPSFAGVQIGKLIDSMGVRILGTLSFVGCCVAWILMRLVTEYSPGHIALLVVFLLVLGLTIVTIEIIAMMEVSQVITDYEAEFPGVFGEKSPIAQAYALFNMSFAAGQLLGPMMAGPIRVNGGWGTMTLVLGLQAGLTAIPFSLFSGPPRKASRTESAGPV